MSDPSGEVAAAGANAFAPDRLTSNRLLARNVALNVAGWAVPVLLALGAIPGLLRGLGEARFGVLSLAWALVGYFSLFDLGMGRALTKLVADALGRDEADGIGALVWTALWAMVPLGVAGAVAIGLAAPWLVSDVLHIPPQLRDESVRAFQIFAVAIPFTVHTAGLRGVLEATQAFGRVNALRVPLAAVTFVGPLLVLPFSATLPATITVLTVGRAILWALHVRICRQSFEPVRHVRAPQLRLLRPLLSVGGWMTVSNVVSPLMNSCDRFVVGAVLTVSAVAHYTTAYETVTRLWVITGVLLPVLFPALSVAFARDRGRAADVADRALRVTLLAAFPAALVVGGFAPEWLAAWLGRDVATHVAPLAQGLAAAVFVNVLAQIAYTIVQAAGRADLTGKFHLAELLPYAALLWVLLRWLGPIGVVLAWGARAGADAVALFVASARLLPEARGAIRRVGALTAVLTPAVALPAFIDSTLPRAAYVGAVLLASAVYGWRRLLRPDERSLVRRVLGARLRLLSPDREPA